MARAYLSIGSNLGDRAANCAGAVSRLGLVPGVEVLAVSAAHETRPWGKVDQPDFVNLAVEAECRLGPQELLAVCKGIEGEMGRQPERRWGPRLIDLDLLLYGREVIAEPDLVVPHPQMHRRRFVLEPLAEIAPGALHPLLQKTVSALLGELGAEEGQPRRMAG